MASRFTPYFLALLLTLPFSAVGEDCPPLKSVIPTSEVNETPVPIEVAPIRSKLERIPLIGPMITSAKAKILARPGLMGKILKDQIVTPMGLFIVNPHDPEFLLKWATLSPTRTYLVTANAEAAEHAAAKGLKNVFDAGATMGERATFLVKKCAVQGTVGLGVGAAVKTLEEVLDDDHHQTLSENARDVLLHSASTGGYFFLTACIRYQTLDKLNKKIPVWFEKLGMSPKMNSRATTGLLTSLYLGNAVTSAYVYGKAIKAEDLVRKLGDDQKDEQKIQVIDVKLNADGTVTKTAPRNP